MILSMKERTIKERVRERIRRGGTISATETQIIRPDKTRQGYPVGGHTSSSLHMMAVEERFRMQRKLKDNGIVK